MNSIKSYYLGLRSPLLGVVFALVFCILLLVSMGESPMVLVEALQNTLFTSFGLGYTLFYSTPLILTGLSVAICFRCGLFNIGCEGQLYIGSISVVAVAVLFPNLPWPLALLFGMLGALVGGGLWGGMVGYLKATRGSHEVIVTILLNFIGIALTNYLILNALKNPEAQRPETLLIGENYFLPTLEKAGSWIGLEWFTSTPVNLSFLFALVLAVCCYYFLFRTTYGFELRSVGFNQSASRFAGISVLKNYTLAFAISGALAGFVGVNEVMGNVHRVVEGFSPGYGFTGIAVALLARNHPIGIIFSGLLFGALHNSALEIEFLSEIVTKELSVVLQGVIIGFVACDYLIEKLFLKKGVPA